MCYSCNINNIKLLLNQNIHIRVQYTTEGDDDADDDRDDAQTKCIKRIIK